LLENALYLLAADWGKYRGEGGRRLGATRITVTLVLEFEGRNPVRSLRPAVVVFNLRSAIKDRPIAANRDTGFAPLAIPSGVRHSLRASGFPTSSIRKLRVLEQQLKRSRDSP